MFTYHQENADYLTKIADAMKLPYYFKKWVEGAGLKHKKRLNKKNIKQLLSAEEELANQLELE